MRGLEAKQSSIHRRTDAIVCQNILREQW